MAEENIYQKLAKIRKPVEVIRKNKRGYGYTYVDEETILSRITALMDKYGVSLIPQVTPGSATVEPYHYTKTKTTKNGEVYEEHVNEVIVKAEMEWIWVNNENPADRIVVPWLLVGSQSDPSQSFGSALTYASRYFLLKYFNVATSENDPDEYRRKQKEAEEEENLMMAGKIVDQIHGFVTTHLTENPDDKEKVAEIVKQYAKEKGKPSGNYFVIGNPTVATQLLNKLKEEFCKGE